MLVNGKIVTTPPPRRTAVAFARSLLTMTGRAGLKSRSSAVHHAIQLLDDPELEQT